MNTKRKIFISYSTGDTETAQSVKKQLESSGFQCWMALDDILPGDSSWPRAITRALQECRAMVLLCSKHSFQSPEVSKELTLAMSWKVKVIPFRLEQITATGEWAYHLANIQWFDAFSRDLSASCEALARHLHDVLREENQPDQAAAGPAPSPSGGDCSLLKKTYIEGVAEEFGVLASVFTMLRLNYQSADTSSTQSALSLDKLVKARKAEMSGGLSLETFNKPSGRWMLAGLPGCGKSTLMKMIALRAASSALGAVGQKGRMPVFLELSRYEQGRLLDLSMVRENMSRFGGRAFSMEDVRSLMDEGDVLWVLDGLDGGMIGERKAADTPLWREIESLVSQWPGHSFVISTRKSHLPAGSCFETVFINDLSPEECLQFLSRYLDCLGSGQTAEEVYNAIPAEMKPLAASPLVLSMILSLHSTQGEFPATIGQLYRAFVVHSLEEVSGLHNRVDLYVKDMALGGLAFEMLTSAKPVIRQTDALAFLEKIMSQLAERGEIANAPSATEILEELVYSGLLVRQDYRISFLRLTLLEYFADREMIREYSFKASPAMDQHYLRNPEKIQAILSAAGITTSDRLMEVGAGIGIVARHFPPSKSLTLVDRDSNLVRILRRQFPQACVLEKDALEALRELPCDILVSNLPFFLTGSILDILADISFKRAVLSVHANDDFSAFEGKLKIETLATLDEEDFFPRKPFQSRLIKVQPL